MSGLSHELQKLPSKKDHPTIMGMPRGVLVKGMQRVDVTVIVTVVQGTVWLSISPPFTWEASMEPGKVDELVHVLELARDEAEKMVAVRRELSPRANSAVVQMITKNTNY